MNNYEAPVVVQMGSAHELILGEKPVGIRDSELVEGRQDQTTDIDE